LCIHLVSGFPSEDTILFLRKKAVAWSNFVKTNDMKDSALLRFERHEFASFIEWKNACHYGMIV